MKIAIASDHAGYQRKAQVCEWLKKHNIEYEDLGTHSLDSTDYPVYAKKVAEKILSKECDNGILICGTGIGMSIAINRFKGIRGTLCLNSRMATLAKKHNNSNVLCMPARKFCFCKAKKILKAYFNAEFEGGRHQKRVDMLDELGQ